MELLQEDAGTFFLASWHMLANSASWGGFPAKLPAGESGSCRLGGKALPGGGAFILVVYLLTAQIFTPCLRYEVGPVPGAGRTRWAGWDGPGAAWAGGVDQERTAWRPHSSAVLSAPAGIWWLLPSSPAPRPSQPLGQPVPSSGRPQPGMPLWGPSSGPTQPCPVPVSVALNPLLLVVSVTLPALGKEVYFWKSRG